MDVAGLFYMMTTCYCKKLPNTVCCDLIRTFADGLLQFHLNFRSNIPPTQQEFRLCTVCLLRRLVTEFTRLWLSGTCLPLKARGLQDEKTTKSRAASQVQNLHGQTAFSMCKHRSEVDCTPTAARLVFKPRLLPLKWAYIRVLKIAQPCDWLATLILAAYTNIAAFNSRDT